MAIQTINIPLSVFSNYFVNISLEGNSYEIWLYYNERMEQWIINLSDSQGDPIILGQTLSPDYPLFLDYILEDLTGYFYLYPIGKSQNETVQNPFELNKYYELYYVYDDGESDDT